MMTNVAAISSRFPAESSAIAVQHLTQDGDAIACQHHPEHELLEVRAMILGVAVGNPRWPLALT
jgi:hypothetical protein